VSSVLKQTRPVDQIVVSFDNERLGAAENRNKTWRAATTDWVAFLDDDDTLDANHIEVLLNHASKTGADLVFPWHRIDARAQGMFQEDIDILNARGIKDEDIVAELEKRNFIPINVLVRRSALEAVGGFPKPFSEDWPHEAHEDWGCWKKLVKAGYKFSHTPEVTWTWYHWGHSSPEHPGIGNTSGLASRW
jgi:glycosyltransferase involved in cell wall biosynthesis